MKEVQEEKEKGKYRNVNGRAKGRDMDGRTMLWKNIKGKESIKKRIAKCKNVKETAEGRDIESEEVQNSGMT